jgi:hypothetical protein
MNTKPPDTNLCFRQTKSFLIDLWKIPTRGDDTQLAIEAPGEAVEFASQVRNVTAGLAQNSSAMETDIKKALISVGVERITIKDLSATSYTT